MQKILISSNVECCQNYLQEYTLTSDVTAEEQVISLGVMSLINSKLIPLEVYEFFINTVDLMQMNLFKKT